MTRFIGRFLQVTAVIATVAIAWVHAGGASAATTITYRSPFQTAITETSIETMADYDTDNGGVMGAELKHYKTTTAFLSAFDPQSEALPAGTGTLRAVYQGPGILPYSGYGARTCFREASVGTQCGEWRFVRTGIQLSVPTMAAPTAGPREDLNAGEFVVQARRLTWNATMAGPRAAGQLRLERQAEDGSVGKSAMNAFSERSFNATSGTVSFYADAGEPVTYRACYGTRFTPAPANTIEFIKFPPIDRCTAWQTYNVAA